MTKLTDKLPPTAFAPAAPIVSAAIERPMRPALLARLHQQRAAWWALGVVLVIVGGVIASFWLAGDPNQTHLNATNLPPKWGRWHLPLVAGYQDGIDVYAQKGLPPSTYYLLGTDYLGRDLLSRLLVGTRISLLIAVVAAGCDLVIGVGYGLISGWCGGWIDTLMQRVLEIMAAVPNLIVIILMLLVMKPGLVTIITAIALTSWLPMARLVRAQTLQLKQQGFVLASQSLGASGFRIAWRHLVPNLRAPIIVQTMLTIPTAIFFEAFLSYVGIGLPAPIASLGTLLNDGQKALQTQPHLLAYPAIVIVVLMVAFNLLADGLTTAWSPRKEGGWR